MIKFIKKIIYTLLILSILLASGVFLINLYVLKTGENNIVSEDKLTNVPYVLVFGASVYGNKVSHALSQRLDKTYELYNKGKADKIIVSGDHQTTDYNEVNAMKNYLIKKGIPETDILMDHNGIDTFTSVKDIKVNYPDKDFVFVTQEEHLKRALYFAKKLGIEAIGVSCDNYSDEQVEYQTKREFLARIKAFVLCDICKNDTDKLNKLLEMINYENID